MFDILRCSCLSLCRLPCRTNTAKSKCCTWPSVLLLSVTEQINLKVVCYEMMQAKFSQRCSCFVTARLNSKISMLRRQQLPNVHKACTVYMRHICLPRQLICENILNQKYVSVCVRCSCHCLV